MALDGTLVLCTVGKTDTVEPPNPIEGLPDEDSVELMELVLEVLKAS